VGRAHMQIEGSMDERTFDAALRALQAGTTRRAGLGAALAVLATGIAGTARAGGPAAAGPCGSDPQQNTCRQNSDCCTGICKITKRGKGRCRCVQVGQACTSNANCCAMGGEPMVCRSRVCLVPA
jgi:hypothetical protein